MDKPELEEIANKIRPQLKEIHPDLTVTVEKRRVETYLGESYNGWVLLFKCGELQFSSEGVKDMNSVRKIFLDASKKIKDIDEYNNSQTDSDKQICEHLQKEINAGLPEAESKIWHGHPVWFLEGNPIVGYHKLKDSVRLLFWSGQSFEEAGLQKEGRFKAAQIRYTSEDQINKDNLKRWLKKAKDIQWDYKNIVKRRGQLIRLK